MSATQPPARSCCALLRIWILKIVTFLVMAMIFGWFYAWASPWAFPKETRPAFGYGMLHGALMPMALPSLAMGKDVEIFASDNSGRSYKLGYIVGINLCGLVFFGSAFWRPRRPVADAEA